MIIRHLKNTIVAIFMVTAFAPAFCSPLAWQGWGGYEPHSGQSIFDLINQQEVVEMTLTGEIDSLVNVRKTRDYSHADLSYIDELGMAHSYRIKVKPRGKFRRRVCDFPPLKIKFSKDELEAAGLSKHNDLKLVSHCMDDAEYNESLILREYLAYKLFNELSPNSLRTQLVRITYQDKHNKRNKVTQYGFLIEDVDELAERMGGLECDNCLGLKENQIITSQEKIVALFQYMIGNVDWDLSMHRNVKLIKMNDGSHIPVPYDFDYSVFVSAPYLRPNPDVEQSNAMERIYLGHTQEADKLHGTISYFKTKKDALFDIIHNFSHLSKRERFELELYVKGFFDLLDTKENAENMIFRTRNYGVR